MENVEWRVEEIFLPRQAAPILFQLRTLHFQFYIS